MNNGVNFGANWNEFDLFNIPVTTSTYTPAQPISTPIDSIRNSYGEAVSVTIYIPGGWSETVIGNGFDLFGGIDWTWWKTFLKEAVNPLPELQEGGCGKVFIDAFTNGGVVSAVSDNLDGGPGTGPDDFIKQVGTIAAAQYAVDSGLAIPLRSSVYRGILEGTETAASSFVVADVYTREYQGFSAEISAYRAGGCH
jgi:hypothetical protein